MKQGFPPIADARATVLILGSMPSEESLRKKQYYGNPHNAFWKIMARLLEFEHAAIYAERTRILTNNKMALWDVMQTCERQGSLDSAIIDSTIVANDFVSFYHRHPNIKHVFFNGTKAEKEYCKRALPKLSSETKGIEYSRLPSTSPAMASLSFEVKLREWSVICADKRAT
ncbi:DNA-deoxyinosine glycosylase [Candidatus Spongiihabitans sp.]|uniref:DNA-deoxyinosine glycosylase n=1 Tax=Candidatus Spongiihabitans sp. TaxID=3101308 RepID=UPI003C7984D8